MNKYEPAFGLKRLAQNYVSQVVKSRQRPNFNTFKNS